MAGDSLLRLPLAGDCPWPTADACWAVAAATEEEGAGQAGSRLRLALALGGYRLGSGVRDREGEACSGRPGGASPLGLEGGRRGTAAAAVVLKNGEEVRAARLPRTQRR